MFLKVVVVSSCEDPVIAYIVTPWYTGPPTLVIYLCIVARYLCSKFIHLGLWSPCLDRAAVPRLGLINQDKCSGCYLKCLWPLQTVGEQSWSELTRLLTSEHNDMSFNRSLKYIDIRLIDRGFLYRSSLELEFSAIACYISTGAGSRNAGVEGSSDAVIGDGEENKDDSSTSSAPAKTSHYSSNYPLPVILVSRSAFKAFQTDFYGYPKHLLLPTTPQTRWTGHGRPHLVTSNPANQSLYYRKWTEPKPSNLVGTQCSSVNSRMVINMRSASGIVISPDIPGKHHYVLPSIQH